MRPGVGRKRENVRTVTQSSRRSCFQIPLMFASALEGRSSRQLQADRRGPAPGCRGTRHNEGCQRCGFPPIRAPAHLLVGPSHHSRLQGAGWPRGRVHSACRNPVAGRPPLSERLHLIVLLPIPPPLPPDSVGDRHHGLVNQPIQCGGTGECAGRMRKPLARIAGRLRSCGTQWPPTFFVWARSVRWVPHVYTSVLLHPTYSATPV